MRSLLGMRYNRLHWRSTITTSRCPIPGQHIFCQKEFSTKLRKFTEARLANCIRNVNLPKGWMEELVALGPDLAYVLASLANDGQITAAEIKEARVGLPSLSYTKWSELAPSFNLPNVLNMAQFDSYSIAPILLPPSFHETTAEAAWHIQDVYQVQQLEDELQIRVLDAYIIPIVGLFQGRIIDDSQVEPERGTSTVYSSGDEVDHELLLMTEGVLFIIIKKKRDYEGQDNTAQLFLELLSVARRNKHARLEGIRVYGLLTNLNFFHFYSYDQSQRKFAFDETLRASFRSDREMFMMDMIHVTNKIFTIVLLGYLEGLVASIKLMHERPLPPSPTSLLRNPADNTENRIKQWELALSYAKQCLNKFKEPIHTVEDVEKQSNKAIKLLTKSVCCIPRHVPYYFSGKEDPSTKKELKALAHRIVHTEYVTIVGGSAT